MTPQKRTVVLALMIASAMLNVPDAILQHAKQVLEVLVVLHMTLELARAWFK